MRFDEIVSGLRFVATVAPISAFKTTIIRSGHVASRGQGDQLRYCNKRDNLQWDRTGLRSKADNFIGRLPHAAREWCIGHVCAERIHGGRSKKWSVAEARTNLVADYTIFQCCRACHNQDAVQNSDRSVNHLLMCAIGRLLPILKSFHECRVSSVQPAAAVKLQIFTLSAMFPQCPIGYTCEVIGRDNTKSVRAA